MRFSSLSTCAALVIFSNASAQDTHWTLAPGGLGELTLAAPATFAPSESKGGLIFDGELQLITVAPRADLAKLPTEAFSVAAWVSVDVPKRWGGICGAVQDDNDVERGWILGYDDRSFTFALSTVGADDGNGILSYLASETAYERGRWYHVAATYDGKVASLFVDGEKEAASTFQHGPILYDESAPFVIGAYQDTNETHRHDGRLAEVLLVERALEEKSIKGMFRGQRDRKSARPWTDTPFAWEIIPYLTWPRVDGVSVLFQTTAPSNATVTAWRDTGEDRRAWQSEEARTLHEFQLRGLEQHAKYFYQVSVAAPDGQTIDSPVHSFRTAAGPTDAFTFAVLGDSQTNTEVAKRVSDLAYSHRPNFVLHAGDLVDTGSDERQWVDDFFPSMQPLLSHVPIVSVLGNHEQDAPEYYAFLSLPEPESYYQLTYGNADFFCLDGNRSLAEKSAQIEWLAKALAGSRATWKIAVLHQPPYTSDSDDYGDTYSGPSKRGDPNVRNIIELLERFDVDVCFSGHVHDYERTFPIKNAAVTDVANGGVVYVTAAGAGGSLEAFDPVNTWFGHKKANVHHFVYVAIHGEHLELQAIDEQGRLFDTWSLDKRDRATRK